jgi:N-acetylmuramoyl-L-alanine amidase
MSPIPIVGKVFSDAAGFLSYLQGLKFGAWRPRFVTMHHTGAPDLKTWQGWQTRAKPVSDAQWLKNLAGYYGSLGWSSGPHFFITPKHYCVLSDPTKRGVHAVSFNATGWGVEVVGDFDREKLSGAYLDWVADGLAQMHAAAGLKPGPYKFNASGLHFHRDDPKTKKTCPGKSIAKGAMIDVIAKMMAAPPRATYP